MGSKRHVDGRARSPLTLNARFDWWSWWRCGRRQIEEAWPAKHESSRKFWPLVTTSGSSNGSAAAAMAFRAPVELFSFVGLASAFADDTQIVQRVGEISVSGAELFCLNGGPATQTLLSGWPITNGRRMFCSIDEHVNSGRIGHGGFSSARFKSIPRFARVRSLRQRGTRLAVTSSA